MKIAHQFFNADTGIKAVVYVARDGDGFEAVAYDVDSDRMIAVRCFADEFDAADYARKFTADTVPAGTSMTI